MGIISFTERESLDLVNYQISSISKRVEQRQISIQDVGDLLPGAVMVQDLSTPRLTYMNTWGCETLDHPLDELVQMGDDYYRKFFIEEESKVFMAGLVNFVNNNDPTAFYSFYQTVKTSRNMEPAPYYTTCRLLQKERSTAATNELILIANPVPGLEKTTRKLLKFLDQTEYAVRNHKKFLLLSPREKDVITLLADGKSSRQISDILFLSPHTVNTHRKNISRKLDINSFAELFKFANAFDLVRY